MLYTICSSISSGMSIRHYHQSCSIAATFLSLSMESIRGISDLDLPEQRSLQHFQDWRKWAHQRCQMRCNGTWPRTRTLSGIPGVHARVWISRCNFHRSHDLPPPQFNPAQPPGFRDQTELCIRDTVLLPLWAPLLVLTFLESLIMRQSSARMDLGLRRLLIRFRSVLL